MPKDKSSEKRLTRREESNLLARNFSDLHPKTVRKFSQLSKEDQDTFFAKTIDGDSVASNPHFLYRILVHNHEELLNRKSGDFKIITVPQEMLSPNMALSKLTSMARQEEEKKFGDMGVLRSRQEESLFAWSCDNARSTSTARITEIVTAFREEQGWNILREELDYALKSDLLKADFVIKQFPTCLADMVAAKFYKGLFSSEAIIKLFVAEPELVSSVLQKEGRALYIEFSVRRGGVSKKKRICLDISAKLAVSGNIISFIEEAMMREISDNRVNYSGKKISIEIEGFGKSEYQIAKKFSRQNLELTKKDETAAIEEAATTFGKGVIERYLPIIFEAISHEDFEVSLAFINANRELLTTAMDVECLNQAPALAITKLLTADPKLALCASWKQNEKVLQALGVVIDGEPVEVVEVTDEFIREFRDVLNTQVAVTNLSGAAITKLLAVDPTLALCISWRKEQKVMQALSAVINEDGFEITTKFAEELKRVSAPPHGLAIQHLNQPAITKLLTADPKLALCASWKQNEKVLQALSAVIEGYKVEDMGEFIREFWEVLKTKEAVINLNEPAITKLLTADPTLALCDSWKKEDEVLKALSGVISGDQFKFSENFVREIKDSQFMDGLLAKGCRKKFFKKLQREISSGTLTEVFISNNAAVLLEPKYFIEIYKSFKTREYMSLHTWNKWEDVETFYNRYTDPEMRASFLEPLKREQRGGVITDTIKQAFFNQLLFAVKHDAEFPEEKNRVKVKALLDTLNLDNEPKSAIKTKKTAMLGYIQNRFALNRELFRNLKIQSAVLNEVYEGAFKDFAPVAAEVGGQSQTMLATQASMQAALAKAQQKVAELAAQRTADVRVHAAEIAVEKEKARAAETRADGAEKAAAELRAAKEKVEAENSQLLASLQRQLKDYQAQLIELGAEKAKAESIINGLKETIVHLGAGAKDYLFYIIEKLEKIAERPVMVPRGKRETEKSMGEEFEAFLEELQNNLESMQQDGVLFVPEFEFAIAPPGLLQSQRLTLFGGVRKGAATDTGNSAANRYEGIANPTAPTI